MEIKSLFSLYYLDYTYMLYVDLNDNFSREQNILAKKFDIVRFCVRPLCELQRVAALDAKDIRHHPHLELR